MANSKTEVFTKEKEIFAFKNLKKVVTIPKIGKVSLADALKDEGLMNDLIALGYSGLVTGKEAKSAVAKYNEELEKALSEKTDSSENLDEVEVSNSVKNIASKLNDATERINQLSKDLTGSIEANKLLTQKVDELSLLPEKK